jgi:hypothetical protein
MCIPQHRCSHKSPQSPACHNLLESVPNCLIQI